MSMKENEVSEEHLVSAHGEPISRIILTNFNNRNRGEH